MPDILHRVGIKTPAARVFEALATIDGLSHWWTTLTSGSTAPGGAINFGFCDMKVEESTPNTRIRWKCVRGPEDWIGTTVTFQLKEDAEQTFVIFSHAGWKTPVEFMHHCSTKWAIFLMSLRDWLERAEGHPAPYDVKIHVGD